MILNRRRFLVSAVSAVSVPSLLSAKTQSQVTSGAIGLTLADVQSIYEELPAGQSFHNFDEPRSGTVLYIDFGQDDFARNIWVSGDLEEDSATDLIAWLCPDDIETTQRFEVLTGAGSIASQKTLIMSSAYLAEFDAARSNILATYVMEPSGSAAHPAAKEIRLTVEQSGA